MVKVDIVIKKYRTVIYLIGQTAESTFIGPREEKRF